MPTLGNRSYAPSSVEVVSTPGPAIHAGMTDSTNTSTPNPEIITNTKPVTRADVLVIPDLKDRAYHLPYEVLAETSVIYYYYAVKTIKTGATVSYVRHKVLQATLSAGIQGVAATAVPATHEFGDLWSAIDAESFLTYELVSSSETAAFALLKDLGWADFLEIYGDGAVGSGWNGYGHTY